MLGVALAAGPEAVESEAQMARLGVHRPANRRPASVLVAEQEGHTLGGRLGSFCYCLREMD